MKTLKKVIPGAALLLSPLVPIAVYFHGNWYSFFSLWSVSITFGIISFVYFTGVILLSCRFRFFDRTFGHDKIMVFHGYLALMAFGCAFVHHLLKLVYFDISTLQTWLGLAALILFCLIIVITLLLMVPNVLHRIRFFEKIRVFAGKKRFLDYTVLKGLHNLTVLASFGVYIHVLLASSTQENYVRITVVSIVSGIAALFYLYHKVLRLFFMGRNFYTVKEVHKENDDIVTISMENRGRKIDYKQGQFAFFRFLSKNISPVEHPFSISSAPDNPLLTITVKNLGNYTACLPGLKEGDKALIDGPYGVFTPPVDNKGLVFIAGGIGITPFLSILDFLTKHQPDTPVTLIWACRYKKDLFKRKKFEQAAKQFKKFRFFPILSDEKEFEGSRGFITRKWLEEILLQEKADKNISYYICGPAPMFSAVKKIFKKMGIKNKNIFFESFSL